MKIFAEPGEAAERLAVRAKRRPRKRKSAMSVTGAVLAMLLATCSTDSLKDIRDRAILMVGFASGGRRRSEIAGLRRDQLTIEAPVTVDSGPPLPSPHCQSTWAAPRPAARNTMKWFI